MGIGDGNTSITTKFNLSQVHQMVNYQHIAASNRRNETQEDDHGIADELVKGNGMINRPMKIAVALVNKKSVC